MLVEGLEFVVDCVLTTESDVDGELVELLDDD
jgi:hypothetical protein